MGKGVKLKTLTADQLEGLRYDKPDSVLDSSTVFAVKEPEGHILYGVCPNGDGMNWYDTLDEAIEEVSPNGL